MVLVVNHLTPLLFLPTQRRELALVERFTAKVRVDESGCHIWTAARDHRGYGLFNVKPKLRRAHRVSYVLFAGEIPEGAEIDHLCHTRDVSCDGTNCPHRGCVNPLHLEPVSHRENVLRGRSPSALVAGKTHCPDGHPLSGDNLYVIPSTGGRMCRVCRTRNAKAWRLANPDKVRAQKDAWKAANPEAHRAHKAAYRDRQRAAAATLLTSERG